MPDRPSMPSGSGNKLTANALAGMHPALVGGGERAAAGMPPNGRSAQITNALTGQAAPVGNALTGMAPVASDPAVNALAGGVRSPPAPAPVAAPVAVAAPAAPLPPGGQERHDAVGKALAVDGMSDDDLKGQAARYEWVRGALGQALQQPDLSHADVVQLVADGVRSKIIPSAEASKILGDLPTDPTSLRDALEQRQVIAGHGLVHMMMEQQRRDGEE